MGTEATVSHCPQRTLNDGPGEALVIVLRGWHQPGFLLGPLIRPRSPLTQGEDCRWGVPRRQGDVAVKGSGEYHWPIIGLQC